ncbi:MAG: alanine--tRNA ligase [bacterium]|nr:alanine--tRNA ligase [bacterium]
MDKEPESWLNELMQSSEIRHKFLKFFEGAGHKIVPSSSLIPDDPSVLLTTAGMQQFKKYYTGEADPMKDFKTKNVVSIQKSFRTSDIDEVGDDSHLTFFEMLGNFSFGGYFKKEAIEYAHYFITRELDLKIDYVSIFGGDVEVPEDSESGKIWESLGISNIRKFGREDNFWGPTGKEGPCGPTTEVYVNGVEIWNIVFNEYYSSADKKLRELKQKGVDTGMGLERLATVIQQRKNIFETDLFAPFLELLPPNVPEKNKRVIVDHLRGSAFLMADGLSPSNKEAGYILRRLIRRVLVYENLYKIPEHVLDAILHDVIHEYGGFYPELLTNNNVIREEFVAEKKRFSKALKRGLEELGGVEHMTGKIAFDLYQSLGLPPEVTYELKKFDWHEFEEAKKKHLEISGTGSEKKFGGHGLLLDTGELKAGSEDEIKIVTRLHTATHLLNAALHKVLGDEISQRGSDITPERTRFDFVFSRKMTTEEIKKVEDLVNEAINKNYPVTEKEMPLEEAKKSGAMFFYKGKYPEKVKVYTIGRGDEVFSKELCGGPHVTHTGEIGKFKITKEESSSAGVRRIRAVVE